MALNESTRILKYRKNISKVTENWKINPEYKGTTMRVS